MLIYNITMCKNNKTIHICRSTAVAIQCNTTVGPVV